MLAGLVAGDRREYRALFAPHAVYVASRRAVRTNILRPSMPRSSFPIKTECRTQPPLLSFDVYDAKVTIVDDTATLTWTVNMVARGQHMELSGERYILERSQEGWLIRENHYWTMSRGTMSHAYAMDGAKI